MDARSRYFEVPRVTGRAPCEISGDGLRVPPSRGKNRQTRNCAYLVLVKEAPQQFEVNLDYDSFAPLYDAQPYRGKAMDAGRAPLGIEARSDCQDTRPSWRRRSQVEHHRRIDGSAHMMAPRDNRRQSIRMRACRLTYNRDGHWYADRGRTSATGGRPRNVALRSGQWMVVARYDRC